MTPDEAGKMAGLLGGPAVLGVAALIAFARGVLTGTTREAKAGWQTMGIGLVLVAWFGLFLALAAPAVVESWTADGKVQAEYVLLSATWIVGLSLLVAVCWKARSVVRYLSESYRADEQPLPLRSLRRIFRV